MDPEYLQEQSAIIQLYISSANSYMQLSGAALAVSVIFVEKIAGAKALQPRAYVLCASWGFFLLSIGLAILYEYLAISWLGSITGDWEQLRLSQRLADRKGFVYGSVQIAFYLGAVCFTAAAVDRVLQLEKRRPTSKTPAPVSSCELGSSEAQEQPQVQSSVTDDHSKTQPVGIAPVNVGTEADHPEKSSAANHSITLTMNTTRIGVWAWGLVVISLSITVLWGIFFGDQRPDGFYVRIKECASVIGPIIAASALAWSWFYQMYQKEKSEGRPPKK